MKMYRAIVAGLAVSAVLLVAAAMAEGQKAGPRDFALRAPEAAASQATSTPATSRPLMRKLGPTRTAE